MGLDGKIQPGTFFLRDGVILLGGIKVILDALAAAFQGGYFICQRFWICSVSACRQAMRMLADRCEVQELTLFCTSLIQAERLGTSIGKTLTNQAANMRERHRMRIKAQAMKAPVKMMFPLVLFIFPALFVIVLLPSLISLMHNFIK